jgi:hypothetical protein
LVDNINVEDYAKALNIGLHDEYVPTEAAKLARVGVRQLRQAKRDGELTCISIGSKNYTILGMDLVTWKLSKRTKLASSILPRIAKGIGAVHGMTAPLNSESALACAHNALNQPRPS